MALSADAKTVACALEVTVAACVLKVGLDPCVLNVVQKVAGEISVQIGAIVTTELTAIPSPVFVVVLQVSPEIGLMSLI